MEDPVAAIVIAPLWAVPPVAACRVVIVLLSTTCPEIVIVSPTLERSKLKAFDPAGTLGGAPTAIIILSSEVGLDPVNLICLLAAVVPS